MFLLICCESLEVVKATREIKGHFSPDSKKKKEGRGSKRDRLRGGLLTKKQQVTTGGIKHCLSYEGEEK